MKSQFVQFVTVSAVVLATVAMAIKLWNLIVHETGVIDWETTVYLAITFRVILIWVKSRKSKAG